MPTLGRYLRHDVGQREEGVTLLINMVWRWWQGRQREVVVVDVIIRPDSPNCPPHDVVVVQPVLPPVVQGPVIPVVVVPLQ